MLKRQLIQLDGLDPDQLMFHRNFF